MAGRAKLSVDDLGAVQEELYAARTSWYNLGLKLGLTVNNLDAIEGECNSSNHFRKMLTKWLKTAKFPSWNALADGLKSPTIAENQLAEEIEKKYCSIPTAMPDSSTRNIKDETAHQTHSGTVGTQSPHQHHESLLHANSTPPISPGSEEELHILAMQIRGSSTLSTDEKQEPKDFGCGCGKCSFNSFLEKGCPKPVLSMSSFSYLNTEGLSHSQKQILSGRLYCEHEVIVSEFTRLVYKTCKSLVQQGVTVQELVRLLMMLHSFQPTAPLPSRPLLEERIEDLKAANTLDDVFLILRSYMSFFSYQIITVIIDEFGTPEDKENLHNYTTKLDEYSRRSVFECPSYSRTRNDQANLVVKLEGINLEKFNVKHLQVFQSRISNIIKVSKYTLRLCTVEKGCLELTFQMPHFVKELMFPLFESQKTALRAEGVTRLTCDELECSFKLLYHSTYDLWECSSDFQTEEKQWRETRREKKLKMKYQKERLETNKSYREDKPRLITTQIDSGSVTLKIKLRAKMRAQLREESRKEIKVQKTRVQGIRRANRRKLFYHDTCEHLIEWSLIEHPAEPKVRLIQKDDFDRQKDQTLPGGILSLAGYGKHKKHAQLQKGFHQPKLEVIKEEKEIENPQKKEEACKVEKGRRVRRPRQKRKPRTTKAMVMEIQQKQKLYAKKKTICQELIGYLQPLFPSFTSLDMPSIEASAFSIRDSSPSIPTDEAGVFIPHETGRRQSQRDEKRMALRKLINNHVISNKFYFLDISPPTTLRKAYTALKTLKDSLDHYDTIKPRPTSPTSTIDSGIGPELSD